MNAAGQPTTRPLKQAVVLVHGMGEQVPMETLRGFVETMWVRDPDIVARVAGDDAAAGNPIWWKPDSRTGSLELSRITTRHGHLKDKPTDGSQRTDFYEFYWADLTDANTVTQLKDWFLALLVRWPSQVPPDVKAAWHALWLLTLAFGGFALWAALHKIGLVEWFPSWAVVVSAIGAALYTLVLAAALNTFGDVARYVRAKPPNIAARRAIRERGLALLRKISDSGQYDRIVLVAHSLGSIVAYDLLRFFWSERDGPRTMEKGDPLHTAYLAVERAATALNAKAKPNVASDDERSAAREAYRQAQQALFAAMPATPNRQDPWLISDFVTVGSPLAHAAFLLARDEQDFKSRVDERRFPSCPPVFEAGNSFLYQPERTTAPTKWQAHHATVFAAVRWTNIYDSASSIMLGDLISGPLVPVLGKGIVDQEVTIRRNSWVWPRFFTHTLYWNQTNTSSPQLPLLRAALGLIRPYIPANHAAHHAVEQQTKPVNVSAARQVT